MGVTNSPDFELIGFLICAGSIVGQSLGIVMTAFVSYIISKIRMIAVAFLALMSLTFVINI